MARYIDADTLVEHIKDLPTWYEDGLGWHSIKYPDGMFDCYDVIESINNQPAADVAVVRHGVWIYHECVSSYDGAISGYSCSLCSSFVDEEIFESDGFHDEFCGHCGADMRGVEDGR